MSSISLASDAYHIGAVAPDAPPPADIKRLQLLLIKPSKYDDEGYVMRYVRGVLPSNTLATLAGLTEEVVAQGALGDIHVEVVMMDEHVQKIDPRKLAKKYGRRGTRVVAALCGVQTNQFPRAADMARELKGAGITVMIGGFHVSGSIAMSTAGMPPELQTLLDDGITLVKGEVEETWGDLLRDAVHGRLKTYYDITEKPDLSHANIPVVDPKLMKRFSYPFMGTIDAGRGCPFSCSFCTIINEQGRKMRYRLAERIKERMRDNAALKIDYYFFTDDNFARNPNWEDIFDAIIDLRQNEGVKFQFMMQVDVLGYKLKNFMSKAAEAGCSQVFIGMETINPANLDAAGKRQNKVQDYKNMIDAWHAHGIACHVGYIIGFPFDSVESVREDVRRLKDEIGVDQASFFMLTPLPGSQDHSDMVQRGEWMDSDYNRFDSFHPTTNHPRMSAQEWFGVYKQAWRDFYSVAHMKTVLLRANEWTYWGLFKNFVWYKHSAIIEDTHPMICGFFRIKDRQQRRPGSQIDPVFTHYRRRAGEVWHWLKECGKFYLEMQEVWLATRGQTRLRRNMDELRRQYEEMLEKFGESKSRAGDAISSRVAGMRSGAHDAWQKASTAAGNAADDMGGRFDRLRQQHEPRISGFKRFVNRINPFTIRQETRQHLNAYWVQTYNKVRRGRIYAINPFTLTLNAWRDAKIFMMFNLTFFFSHGK